MTLTLSSIVKRLVFLCIGDYIPEPPTDASKKGQIFFKKLLTITGLADRISKCCGASFQNKDAQTAQLVEQRTENPRVTGSIPVLGICASGSVVERLLAKEKVAGSTPVSRFF